MLHTVEYPIATHPNGSLTIGIATLRHIIQLAGQNFEDFFKAVSMESAKLVGADGAALIVQDSDGILRYKFFNGLPDVLQQQMQDYRFSQNEGTVGQALKTGQPLFTADYASSPRAMANFVKLGLRANLILPIRSDGEYPVVAILAISWFNHRPELAPTAAQLELIGLYCDFLQAGLVRQAMINAWRLQANRDALTGLPNRRALLEHLPAALDRAQRQTTWVAVCVMDLNNFKPVNDEFGHAAGDSLLMELAYRLKSIMRTTDMVARLGGDEFVVILENIDSEIQMAVALNRIHQTVVAPYTLRQHKSVHIGMSMGVTVYPEDPVEADRLLRHADQALYLAKEHKTKPGDFWRRWQPAPASQ